MNKKDDKYFERRKQNKMAAKKSRDQGEYSLASF
jgi:hypothetical protein